MDWEQLAPYFLGYCEHGSETPGSIKGWEFFNQLGGRQLVKNWMFLYNDMILSFFRCGLNRRF